MNEKYRKICEDLGWSLTDERDGSFYVSQYSPKGEDFGFSVPVDNFVQAVREYYEDFDVDEHVEMWLEARKNGVQGVPASIEALVDDAKAIDDMLEKLALALSDAEQEEEGA